MKTTKDNVFEYIQKETMTNPEYKDGISTSAVAGYFGLQRSNISSVLNELVKEGRLVKTVTRPVLYFLPQKAAPDSFENTDRIMIGHDGSLANSLQIAKAAIYYPGKKLNVLVKAKPGCGTTHFVYSMYVYGKKAGAFRNDAPFYKINCRHYKNNIEELYDILFRPDEMEKSLFAQARGGMLFIDNADLLSPREKTRLADFLESGQIFSTDRKSFLDCRDTFLTVSCSPAGYSEFSARMSMVVTLPELSKRPLKEKLDLINYFFTVEANNAKRNIETKREVIEALLLNEFEHNVKGLEMEIKRACATACVRVVDDPDSNIEVTLYDFNTDIQKSMVRMRLRSESITELLGTQALFIYDSRESFQTITYDKTNQLYEDMRLQYAELSKRGVNVETIHNIINNHVKNLFEQYNYYRSFNDDYDIEQLSKIVDEKIIRMVSDVIEFCRRDLKKDIRPQVFYGLCLHMNSLITLQNNRSRIDDDKVVHIVQDYPREYGVSIQLAQMFEDTYGIKLPMEEIVIITMFFLEDEKEQKEGHPVLLYIFHGNGIAGSLREITNTLTHTNNAYSYDLLLEKSSKDALEEIKTLIQKIDQGKGIIVIYDMGSIKTMLDTISSEVNIKIRYIYFPITLVGLEVARKCTQEEDLDYLYHTTMQEMKNIMQLNNGRKEIIITLCHTGEGGAYQLKQYIDQYSSLGIKTVPLAITKRDLLIQQIMELKKVYHIHCFVGTYDPKLMGIPFVSMNKIFENRPEDLDRILMFEPIQAKQMDYTKIYAFLEEQFKTVSIAELKSILPSVIDEFEIIYSLTSDQKTGLFIHIACMLEKIRQGETIERDKDMEEIIALNPDDFKTVSKVLKPLEKKFHIIIDDSQIATIIRIVKRL